MQITRPARRPALISIVPMIDVLLILLVFFMVTSSYLDLDMLPAVDGADEESGQASTQGQTDRATILIRIASDGSVFVAGQHQEPGELASLLRARLTAAPLTNVIILPSARAHLQALVSVMDDATNAGAVRLRVVRLEAAQ